MTQTRRTPGLVLIEASAIATPFLEIESIAERCAQFEWDVRKWLPDGDVIFAFPDEWLSPWAHEVRALLDVSGIRVTTHKSLTHDKLRTRMLWHVYLDVGEEQPAHDVLADRVHRIGVMFGSQPPFVALENKVARYAALMAIPTTPEERGVVAQDFDSFGAVVDESEF